MTRWRLFIALALLLAGGAAPTVVLAEDNPAVAPRQPLRFYLAGRLGAFDMINSPDSYDAVFGEVMPQLGLAFEVEAGRRWLFALSYDYGRVEGERVQVTDPPISTGIDEELTYQPLALTVSWIFRPEARWRVTTGLGVALVDWEDTSAGQSAGGSDFGTHAVVGLRSHGGRWSWGGELRYSQVPDAIGEAGVSRLFDEDDIGGVSLYLVAAWRIR